VICICACISTISSTVASIGNDDSNMSEKDYCESDENATSGVVVEEDKAAPPSYFLQSTHRYQIFEQILAEDFGAMDPALPNIVAQLRKRGAHRCWHKHSTFLDHLLGVHHILRLWEQDRILGRLGLMHSAYSNSYVNLALFDPNDDSEREKMRKIIGREAEDIVYMFCVVDRQSIVVDTLLAQGFIPEDGLDVPHLRDKDIMVHLSPETLRMLTVFTMADIADQYFGWQDRLFGGETQTNSMLIPGEDDISQHESTALWPGISQPGLWMNYVSQLGLVAKTFRLNHDVAGNNIYYRNIPPVFDNCTKVLSREDEYMARELYWSVVMNSIEECEVIEALEASIRYNPWTFEPHVMLAQKYLHANKNEMAKEAAERALDLQMIWGTAYDKRLSFPAWVAWTRVLYQRANESLGWPKNSWDINNFGMVR